MYQRLANDERRQAGEHHVTIRQQQDAHDELVENLEQIIDDLEHSLEASGNARQQPQRPVGCEEECEEWRARFEEEVEVAQFYREQQRVAARFAEHEEAVAFEAYDRLVDEHMQKTAALARETVMSVERNAAYHDRDEAAAELQRQKNQNTNLNQMNASLNKKALEQKEHVKNLEQELAELHA